MTDTEKLQILLDIIASYEDQLLNQSWDGTLYNLIEGIQSDYQSQTTP